MHGFRVLAFAFFLAAFPAISGTQAPSSDSQTLQSLLEEVRHLRQDLQFTAGTLQRMQILIYRVRLQTDVVAQARQRHDEAQTALAEMRTQREQAAAQIKEQEDAISSSNDPNARKYAEVHIERMKHWLEQLAQNEPAEQVKETESANDLRIEQAKLAGLEDQLDRLDSQLSAALRPAPRAP